MRVFILAVTLSFFSFTAFGQTANSEVLIGVVPNMSARMISTQYQPVADYFEKNLGRQVIVTTGTSFPNFYQRVLANEFQIMVTAPNLARVSQADGNWEAIAVFEPGIPGLLVGMADRQNNLEFLREKKLAVANPQSLVALAGMNWLSSQGFVNNRDYEILRIANDDSLGISLRTGEAAFALMSQGEFNSKDTELKKILTPINTFVRLPGFFMMVNANVASGEKQKMTSLILNFQKSEQAKQFFSVTGFTGLQPPTAEQLKFLDSFIEATRQGLDQAK
jgi:ABC-type phosphate/phosphonate transport system substrate-binding protein